MASRPAKAVETDGMIRPLRITETEPVAEGVGLQWSPDGHGLVRASVHGDIHATRPTNVESKLIRLHAEALLAKERRSRRDQTKWN